MFAVKKVHGIARIKRKGFKPRERFKNRRGPFPSVAEQIGYAKGAAASGVRMDWSRVPVCEVKIASAFFRKAPKFPLTNGAAPHGSLMAFRVVINPATKQPTLDPAWISTDFDVPEPPAIAGGVVFVLSTGENTQQTEGSAVIYHGQKQLTDRQRSENTHRAVLYALDAKTGRTLFQSGSDIESWTHFSGLAVADGRIFVVDHDSNVYCFGLAEK